MVLHYSDDLLKTPDPNGGKFGDWIVKKDTFNVTCRLCKSNVCIKEGEKALAKLSSSAHTQARHKAKGAQAGTGNIFQAIAQQDAKQREQKSCEEKARDAELIYLHHIEAHGIPPHVASCTTLLFKQMFPDVGGCFGAWIDHLDSFKNPNPRHSKVGFLKLVCYKHCLLLAVHCRVETVKNHLQQYFEQARQVLQQGSQQGSQHVIELCMMFVQCLEVSIRSCR